MEEQLVETWQIHDRINLYLLNAIADEALGAAITPKNRTVSSLFAHFNNVRLMWIQSAAPDLLAGLPKLPTDAVCTKAEIVEALGKTGAAMAEIIRRGAATGKVKGFKPHVVAFLGYIISHESHHRGQIGWTLKNTGHPLDKKTAFGLWEWGVR